MIDFINVNPEEKITGEFVPIDIIKKLSKPITIEKAINDLRKEINITESLENSINILKDTINESLKESLTNNINKNEREDTMQQDNKNLKIIKNRKVDREKIIYKIIRDIKRDTPEFYRKITRLSSKPIDSLEYVGILQSFFDLDKRKTKSNTYLEILNDMCPTNIEYVNRIMTLYSLDEICSGFDETEDLRHIADRLKEIERKSDESPIVTACSEIDSDKCTCNCKKDEYIPDKIVIYAVKDKLKALRKEINEINKKESELKMQLCNTPFEINLEMRQTIFNNNMKKDLARKEALLNGCKKLSEFIDKYE